MHQRQAPPSKRRRLEDIKETGRHDAVERQYMRAVRASYYPPEFWDTLSTVPLTRTSLAELDRRTLTNRAPAPVPEAKTKQRLLRSDDRQLSLFAQKGGPSLDWLRGFSDMPPTGLGSSSASERTAPSSHERNAVATASSSRGTKRGDAASSSSQANERPPKKRTMTTTPYDEQFEQKMIDVGVFPEWHPRPDGESSYPVPANLQEIRDRIARARDSVPPSTSFDATFHQFTKEARKAKKESKVMAVLLPILCGNEDGHVECEDDQRFSNLDTFGEGIADRKPDRYYGTNPSQLNPRLRKDLSDYILPSSDAGIPAVPNVFFECKGSKGRADVAMRQTMYNGAIGARAMHSLQNYSQTTSAFDGNAYALSITYFAPLGHLAVHATHPRPSEVEKGRVDYHLTEVETYKVTKSPNTLRDGILAYRNARDWGREKREEFIARANAAATARGSG